MNVFLLSFLFSVIFVKSKNIIPSVCIHILWNFMFTLY
ncbi:CPBP family glutamic-type intramembrane protease [Tetragenococcus koreensis]